MDPAVPDLRRRVRAGDSVSQRDIRAHELGAVRETGLRVRPNSWHPMIALAAAVREARSASRGLRARDAIGVADTYFNMRKTTIYGGSNEVQRNIVAQTVLG